MMGLQITLYVQNIYDWIYKNVKKLKWTNKLRKMLISSSNEFKSYTIQFVMPLYSFLISIMAIKTEISLWMGM